MQTVGVKAWLCMGSYSLYGGRLFFVNETAIVVWPLSLSPGPLSATVRGESKTNHNISNFKTEWMATAEIRVGHGCSKNVINHGNWLKPQPIWTTVFTGQLIPHLHQTRTSKQDHNSTTITYYFTNFPTNWNSKTMLEVFKWYGQATNIYIAGKRNKMGKRFGFCRFCGILDPIAFEKTLNAICIGTQRILCNIAHHQCSVFTGSLFPGSNYEQD
ncbi:hypothetical protein CTI12_AA140360 [Artemisia annua]|uniref:RRM domain-containing protein n=1 Tax=Artemisia annua TaxID=35608 RepID=A0A2U1PKX2_ARTAN|nr:hypothetical protein CTI12_AA140360 [Artemisia annua]